MKLRHPKIPKARFNLRNKIENPTLIVLRYTHPSQRIAYSTGLYIDPSHWDSKTGRAKYVRGREEYLDLNKRLNIFAEICESIFIDSDYGRIRPEDFKNELDYLTGKKTRPGKLKAESFFEFIDQFIDWEKNKAGAKQGTWKKFITVREHLKNFASEEGYKDLNFEDINWGFKKRFVEWLYKAPRNSSINNAAKIMEVVKQFMKDSRRSELHGNRIPEESGFGVRRVKMKNQPRLTFEELDQLIALDLQDNLRLKKVRDLFIVGAFTGLRFGDWHRFNKDHIKTRKANDGQEFQYIEIVTQKTNTPVVIPLHPKLKSILEEYDFELPKISAQKFNDYIKEVCEIAIPESTFLRIYSESGSTEDQWTPKYKKIGSHSARRSFASNFWEKGLPAQMLMQITGHSTEKQFFQYIDVDKKRLAEEFAKMIGKIKWN